MKGIAQTSCIAKAVITGWAISYLTIKDIARAFAALVRKPSITFQ